MARRIGTLSLIFVLGFAVCAFTLHVLYGAPLPGQPPTDHSLVLAALQKPAPPTPQGNNPIVFAAKQVMPAVVTIDTESKPISVNNPMSNDPFFRQFFGGDVAPQTEREEGVGSGVLISPDGYIITNNHVVANAATMNVILSDGTHYKARLIGTDPTTDIAVCKIDVPNKQLPYAQLGDSKSLEVGTPVIAVGNPLDVGTTVTNGIVSALGHRNGVSSGAHPLASDIIQTDAAINPGNSGGALADLTGHVIGINEAIYSPNGNFIGIGFAIPIDTARDIAEQLIKTGQVIRPYIGIEYEPLKVLNASDRQQIGISEKGDDGAIVVSVMPGSPAAAAGLQQYDVILQANRQTITSDSNSLQSVIDKLKPDDKLVLLVDRGGRQMLISVTVKQMPKDFGQQPENEQQQEQQPDQGDGGGQEMPGFGQ